eukprot:1033932-Pyramimonas_sp.AAC.1
MADDVAAAALHTDAQKLCLLVRLCSTKPALIEELKDRLESGVPLIVKGVEIPTRVIRSALEQLDSGADPPMIHSSTAAGSGDAAPVAPAGEAAAFE